MEAEHGHVHEFDLTRTPDGRTLALLASPDLEATTANPPLFNDGIGDLLIVDITNPSNPTLLSHWGVLHELALGLDVYLGVLAGGDARMLDHSVRANKDGTLAYVSYWDAGYIILDISDPSDPVFVGRAAYMPGEEGNAHSVDESPNGQFLAAADEDFSPFELRFSSSAFPGFQGCVRGHVHGSDRHLG
jgi:LVIVD repeat